MMTPKWLKTGSKKLVRSPLGQSILSFLLVYYLRFAFKTTRWHFDNEVSPMAYWRQGKGFLGCFWHGRMAVMPFIWKSNIPASMLISGHPDGKFISRVIKRLGFATIMGSTSKGGLQAARAILKSLRAGHGVGITPDGPRGPRYHVQGGIVSLAQKAGVDILPVSYMTTRKIIVNSWDEMVIPLPFGRGIICWGDPIPTSKERSKEVAPSLEAQLQQQLLRLNARAGQYFYHKRQVPHAGAL